VLGWPLGNPLMVAPAAVMVNLLGTQKTSGQPRGLNAALRMPGARVHLYGKLMSGLGRKMGHVTVLENSVDEAQAVAERAAKQIYFGERSLKKKIRRSSASSWAATRTGRQWKRLTKSARNSKFRAKWASSPRIARRTTWRVMPRQLINAACA